MSRQRLLWGTLFACVALAGCSSVNSALGGNTPKEAKAEVSWDYARGGIQIELATDDNLNAYNGQAHTVVMGIFQVDDAKTFLKLLGDAAQLKKTLATGDAGKDVIQLDRYVVSPGKHTILKTDRAQGSKFVGIVAGYYDFDPATQAKLFRIPLNMQTSGLISTSYQAQPAELALRLQLGRLRFANAQSLTFDADQKPTLETVPLDPKTLEIDISHKTLTDAEDASGAARKLRKQ